MNNTPDPAGQQRAATPLSEAAKTSLAKTHTLFRTFIFTVLGSLLVIQLDLTYFWLAGILTLASLVLGIVLLIRAGQLKESKLVLFGTVAGLVLSLVMVLMVLGIAAFTNQFSDYQECARRALTDQALSGCVVELRNSLPGM
ncbi:hypothetical protein M1E17_06255 [Arthrobacter sp. D1-29]